MFEEFKIRTENGEKITKEELVSALQQAEDIDPYQHSGCYELVNKIVECYANSDNQVMIKLDYNDLNLIYFMTVTDRKFSPDKKRELIKSSHLDALFQQQIERLFDEIVDKVNNKRYGNNAIGIVGSGFKTCSKVSNTDCQKFIRACIEVRKCQSEEQAFEIIEKIFSNGIKGMQSATGSIVIHCLKPNFFPIVNSKTKFLLGELGLGTKKLTELKYYIDGCRETSAFKKEEKFKWQNYRVLDLLAINVANNKDEIDFDKIKDWLVNYGGTINSKNIKIDRSPGKEAVKEFQKFINLIVANYKNRFTKLETSWQNGFLNYPYIWTRLKDLKHGNQTYSISFSVSTDESDNLKINMGLETNNNKDASLNDEERKQIYRKLLNVEAEDPCYYVDQDYNIIHYQEAKKRLSLGVLEKYRPIFSFKQPIEYGETKRLIEEAKNPFEELIKAYEGIFNEIIIPQNNDQKEKNMKNDNIIKCSKNLILYGPPGTGKTYNSIIYAVAIVESKDLSVIEQEADKDYSVVKSRYDKYIEDGKIAFTTFHQSYGYEEFIEGIKPDTDEDGNVFYKVQDGVFKDFCKKATKTVVPKDQISSLGIDNNSTIWKVSLKGTGKNEVRTDCLANNHIRIGFDSYGANITDETDFSVEGGRNVLNAFISVMKKGDIILSCYSNTSIDAIGVVEGDYEWDEKFPEYKRVRKVKWLVKEIIENIDTHNGNKTFTLGTVYRLNDIDRDWIYGLLANSENKEEKTESDTSPRVFIIDEINRGNISKIFGELITLIEDTKRLGEKEEMKAILPYSKEEFGVPNNVYILGTMNTADRSISLIDTALRRRFAFEEKMPNLNLLKDIVVDGINVQNVLDKMNERITYLYDREHQIGHSFFMKLQDNRTMENLSGIFKDKIIPLLQEYFYDDYEKIRLVLGDNQKKDEDKQFIKKVYKKSKDLFGYDKDNDFDDKAVFEINYGAFKDPQSYRFLANGQIKDTESDDGNTAQAEAAATENE